MRTLWKMRVNETKRVCDKARVRKSKNMDRNRKRERKTVNGNHVFANRIL